MAIKLGTTTATNFKLGSSAVLKLYLGRTVVWPTEALTPAAPTFGLVSDTGISNTDGITNNGSIIVLGLESNTTWQYSLDAGLSWVTGSGSTFILAEGTYAVGSVRVRQRNLSSNLTSPVTQNVVTFVVDTTVPNAPTITSVTDDVSAITGTVSNGGSTNDNILVITGTAEPYTRVTVYNGNSTLGTTNANDLGIWAFTTAVLVNGTTYVFNAKASDLAGNVSTASSNYTVTVDTVAPIIVISDNINGIAHVGQDVTFTFTFSEAVSGFSAANITIGNGTKGTFTVVNTRIYNLVVTPTPASSGNVTVNVATAGVTDSVGNTATVPAQYTQAFDTLAPAAPVLVLGTGVSNGASFVEATAATGVITVSGENSAVILVTFSRTSGGSVSKVLTGTGSAQAVVLSSGDLSILGNGTISVSATQTDAAGNVQVAAPATISFLLDTIAPTVTITDNVTGTATEDVTFTFTFSEPVLGFSAVGITVGNGTKGTFSVISSAVYTLIVSPTPNNSGNLTIDVAGGVCTDTVGNNNITSTQYVQPFDTIVPPGPLSLLVHMEGSNGSNTILDSSSYARTSSFVTGTLTTANKKFGATSFTSGSVSWEGVYAGNIDYPYTAEAWVYRPSSSNAEAYIFRFGDETYGRVYIYHRPDNKLEYEEYFVGARFTSSAAVPLDAWYHLAVVRTSGANTLIFINGTQIGSISNNPIGNNSKFTVFAPGSNHFIDEVRLTAAEVYTSNFTPPTAPFPNS